MTDEVSLQNNIGLILIFLGFVYSLFVQYYKFCFVIFGLFLIMMIKNV